MANNYMPATVYPYFPQALITANSEELSELGVSWESDGYMYLEDGSEDWDRLVALIQAMLLEWNLTDPDNASKYAYIKAAFYCDKMRQDEFGGFAAFITPADTIYHSTDTFIMEQIEKLEGR